MAVNFRGQSTPIRGNLSEREKHSCAVRVGCPRLVVSGLRLNSLEAEFKSPNLCPDMGDSCSYVVSTLLPLRRHHARLLLAAKPSEEDTQVFDKKLRLFKTTEMTAPRHFAEVNQVKIAISEPPAKFLNDNFVLYEEVGKARDHAEAPRASNASARDAHMNERTPILR